MSAWTELGDGLFVRQSCAYQMNSVVFAAEGKAIVFDPGVLPSELSDLAGIVGRLVPALEDVTLVFTHPHWDHVLGRPWFPQAATVAHADFQGVLERDAAEIERSAKAWIEGAGEPWPRAFEPFEPSLALPGTIGVRIAGHEVLAYDMPGHSPGHLAFYLPAQGLFVAGDTLSEIEIPWLDGPPWVYRRSLQTLHWVFEQEQVKWLVSGHGPVVSGRQDAYRRLLRDIDYLLLLEDRAAGAFTRGLSLAEAQAELAAMSYTGKDAGYSMNTVHRENVAFTFRALEAQARGQR